ncbi:MAG: extracellular solute-binding protein, partial [Actinobacteria bacterium]|nr:extracellular solute-binding protein [Actinomycetota bacterium]
CQVNFFFFQNILHFYYSAFILFIWLLVMVFAMSLIFTGAGCKGATAGTTAVSGETTAAAASGETTAATSASSSSEIKPVNLTLWINGADSFLGPEEQKKAQDQWYISQAIKRFETQNPGVTIELTVNADAGLAHQAFKTASLAGNAPDIANLWIGQFLFGAKDVIAPLNNYIPKEDLTNISGWENVTLDFQKDGPILGYTVPDNQIAFLMYNKKIIQDCGLDFENNPPRTRDAYLDDMKIIKNKGYTPMVVDEGFGHPYYFFWIAAYWWIQQDGVGPIMASDQSKSNFADDKGLMSAIDLYQQTYAKGYLNQDCATSSDSLNKFLQGKAAMIPSIASYVADAQKALGEENVGVILPPNISDTTITKDGEMGGAGQVLVVSKDSKNIEMAVKFLSFVNSKPEVLEFYKINGVKIPTRKDITGSDLNLKPGSVGLKLLNWATTNPPTFWVDGVLSVKAVEAFNKLLPLLLTGKMTPADLANQIDKDKGQQ